MVSNKIKPIKSLCASNEIDVSWKHVNKMLPRTIKSQDHAYTREEIHHMLEQCTDLTNKLIILMFSSGGFSVEARDYFCWKDISLFKDRLGNYKGAGLRVYRGDPEECWTFITPEACYCLNHYKKEWKSRFLRYPKDDDPLLASVRFDKPRRLQQKGVRSRVNKIVTKIGLRDQDKKKTRMHEVKIDHVFRKYFNTMLRRAKVDYMDKEDMMGHKVGPERHYERYVEEDFERFSEYQKAISFLTISDEERLRVQSHKNQSDIVELEQKNTEIHNLKERIDNIEYGITARRSEYEKMNLKARDSGIGKYSTALYAMLFEARAPEHVKRKIWKKTFEQKENSEYDPANFLQQLQPDNKLPMWEQWDKSEIAKMTKQYTPSYDNIYDSGKHLLTEQERQDYEESRRQKKRDKADGKNFLQSQIQSYVRSHGFDEIGL